MIYFDSDMSKSTNTVVYFDWKTVIYIYGIFKLSRNPASKSLQSTEISLYLAFTNKLNVAQKEKNIEEWLILLKTTILLMKS